MLKRVRLRRAIPEQALDALTMRTFDMRTYKPGDEEDIIKLLRETMAWPGFEHQGDEVDFWRWKYLDNPFGRGTIAIAAMEDKVLSHAANVPAQVKVGGSTWKGTQLSDLLTSPESREQGLVERAMQLMEQADMEQGVELEFTFPSPAGYELGMKIGFVEMSVRMGQYELIVNPERFFESVPFGRLKKLVYQGMKMMKGKGIEGTDVDVEETTLFPDDVEEVAERLEKEFTFVVRRTREYLKWRYTDPVAGKFRILIARKGNATSGFLVLRPYSISGHHYMDIVDLVTVPGDASSLNALIRLTIDICLDDGTDTLQIWLPTDHPFLPDLGRNGFLLRQPFEGERRMRLICRPLPGAEGLREELKRDLRYHIVLGDSDWV